MKIAHCGFTNLHSKCTRSTVILPPHLHLSVCCEWREIWCATRHTWLRVWPEGIRLILIHATLLTLATICVLRSNPASYILNRFVVFQYNRLQNTVTSHGEDQTTFLVVIQATSDHTLATMHGVLHTKSLSMHSKQTGASVAEGSQWIMCTLSADL